MKNLINSSLVLMAISTTGCATSPARAGENYVGRVIEYKSGPEGFDTRTFFYEGEYEVVAVDSHFTSELSRKSIEHLRRFTDKPISWLVITHPNPDKFNGASEFKKEGAKVISSKTTAIAIPGTHEYKQYFFVEKAKMFKPGTYPQPVPVDETFEGKMDLVLRGGERLELRELSGPGVSSTQTTVYLSSIGSLFVGDLVHHKAHAWLEGGIVNGKATPTLGSWVNDLKEIQKIYPAKAKVYGGRGETGVVSVVVPEQIKYLQAAQKLIRKELQAMGKNRDQFNGPNAGEAYKALAGKFEKAFPGYSLAYMIEYGAYGLVQSEIAKLK